MRFFNNELKDGTTVLGVEIGNAEYYSTLGSRRLMERFEVAILSRLASMVAAYYFKKYKDEIIANIKIEDVNTLINKEIRERLMKGNTHMKYAILKLRPNVFIHICQNRLHGFQLVGNELPQDAKFIRAYCDDNRGWGWISLVLESQSFKELNEGDEIPVLESPVFDLIKQDQR